MPDSDRSQPRWFTEDFGNTPPGIAAVLEGKTCLALLVQANWLGDELIEPANVVFVQTAPTTWVRFYVDAGVLGWTVEPELRAIAPYELGSGESMRYPITDVGTQWALIAQRIERVTFEERRPAPQVY